MAYFIVIENGGTVSDRDAASAAINVTLGELAKLRRSRAKRDAVIHIVTTANPTEVSWSGTPAQLYEQGHTVLEKVAFRDTCSDLELAWEQVYLTAEVSMPDEMRIISIGPMIHAGFPCDQGDRTISLPQPAPKDLKLGDLAERASQLLLLNVHPDQDNIYVALLRDRGVLERAAKGELHFDLMDPARTKASLGRILKERRS